eukprot:1158230-Pelagomonas_calceolata.AAC.8
MFCSTSRRTIGKLLIGIPASATQAGTSRVESVYQAAILSALSRQSEAKAPVLHDMQAPATASKAAAATPTGVLPEATKQGSRGHGLLQALRAMLRPCTGALHSGPFCYSSKEQHTSSSTGAMQLQQPLVASIPTSGPKFPTQLDASLALGCIGISDCMDWLPNVYEAQLRCCVMLAEKPTAFRAPRLGCAGLSTPVKCSSKCARVCSRQAHLTAFKRMPAAQVLETLVRKCFKRHTTAIGYDGSNVLQIYRHAYYILVE